MPKDKIIDLHHHLLAQLERLSDEDISGVELEREIRRTEAMVPLGNTLLKGYDLAFRIAATTAKINGGNVKLPSMLLDASTRGVGHDES